VLHQIPECHTRAIRDPYTLPVYSRLSYAGHPTVGRLLALLKVLGCREGPRLTANPSSLLLRKRCPCAATCGSWAQGMHHF
jgi:hypothetical protein